MSQAGIVFTIVMLVVVFAALVVAAFLDRWRSRRVISSPREGGPDARPLLRPDAYSHSEPAHGAAEPERRGPRSGRRAR